MDIKLTAASESKDIAIVEFDMAGEKVNKFNSAMLYGLLRLGELKSSYKCVILTNKPKFL